MILSLTQENINEQSRVLHPATEENDLRMKSTFIKGLKEGDINLLKTVPKSDLHNHAGLGYSFDKLEEWAGKKICRPPDRMKSIDELNDYVRNELRPLYLNYEGFTKAITSAFRQAAEDGVALLEMSVDAQFINLFQNREAGLIDFLERTHQYIAPKTIYRPEIGFAKCSDLSVSIPAAQACLETGYFQCIDVYGKEDCVDFMVFKDLYKNAKKLGVKCKAHIGEFGSAETVRTFVEALEIDVIQHGIRIIESEEVMDWVAKNKIQLNICPTSNVCLERVVQMAMHPIRIFYNKGIPITINTDDILLFGQTINDEYLNLYKAGLFSAEELNEIREYGLNSK